MTNDNINIQIGVHRARLSLQQVSAIINGIYSEYTNNELRSMLEMFISDNDRADGEKVREQAERNAGHQAEVERRGDD